MGSAMNILAIGEILWDLLPGGRQLGGAPANFAYHAHAPGAQAHLVSRVGDDPLGQEALDRLHAIGLPTGGVAVDAVARTGTVSVELSADGQPQFTIHEQVAWDRIVVDEQTTALARESQAICFGSLAQRSEPSRSSIRRLVAATPPGSWRVFDVNLRQQFYCPEVIESSLNLANMLKLNDQELPVLAAMFGLAGSVRDQVASLAGRFQLRAVALTRGASGSMLWHEGSSSEHPGCAVQVVDTVGAGDAFTAAVVLGLLAGRPLAEINRVANQVAAFVCSQPGATPRLPETFRRAFCQAQG